VVITKVRGWAIAAAAECLALLALGAVAQSQTVAASRNRVYDIYAFRYATVRGFPVRYLVAGADTNRKTDIAMMFWLVKRPGRYLLVDAGFYRQKFLDEWKPSNYVRPDEAMRKFGIDPKLITDIFVTHVHWDHLDGADLFPSARVWIQRAEYEHYVGEDGRPLDEAIDALDAAMLAKLMKEKRVELIDGDEQEFLPGLTAYIGGKHTFESQYLGVRTTRGKAIVASDNAYLYENIDKNLSIAQTLDAKSNVAAIERMKKIASSPRLIIPGHDPEVFERFKQRKPGVVMIE
jgi:glyoxylase-like metal-dependent hydrolase (beta-lactamase superfamily II)